MSQIRVLLVDDSPVFLGALTAALNRDPEVTVAGTAMNGQDALEAVPYVRPDVIVCDVQMPKMSGIDLLKTLMPRNPIPVVVISSTPGMTLTALQSGAVDFISKPDPTEPKKAFFDRVLQTVKTAASANMGAKMAIRKGPVRQQTFASMSHTSKDMVVAIGASTGGTDAILAVVRNFPANSPGVVITQHMPAGFTAMYAERLNKECKMRVVEATDGMRLEKGMMILAAGAHQMRLLKDPKGYYVSSRQGEKVSGHIPSVDVLFTSVAETAKNKAVGVILTGMGADGAEGLLKMSRAGAYTIGQDKESSVVYGMPMVAFNKGAVKKQLPLGDIAGEVIRYLNGK